MDDHSALDYVDRFTAAVVRWVDDYLERAAYQGPAWKQAAALELPAVHGRVLQ
ncbi:MAG: hypothetical protein LAO20_14210 [Acidobacteriia bacterium]|nr:hypothetical protein [Terriglobia bacterium]